MNLLQMLNQTVTPLSEHNPDPQARKRMRDKQAKETWKRCNDAANKVVHERAIAKYREVMPPGVWVRTTTIESRLGMSRSSCTPNLTKWEKLGYVEKRRALVAGEWNRSMGNEWRFVK